MFLLRPPIKDLNSTRFGLVSFYVNAENYSSKEDGFSNLDQPNTQPFPASHHVFARYHRLIEHLQSNPSCLSNYLGIAKTTYGQIIIASSIEGEVLKDKLLKQGPLTSESNLKRILNQLLFAIEHVHNLGIIIGNLSISNILIDEFDKVQLYNYGLYYITGGGSDVSFHFMKTDFPAPEFKETDPDAVKLTIASDIWDLGIVLLKIWTGNAVQSDEENHPKIPESMTTEFKSLIMKCLSPDPNNRPSIGSLYNHSFMNGVEKLNTWFKRPYIPNIDNSIHKVDSFTLTYREIYHFWNLLGGDLKRKIPDLATKRPPILSFPKFVSKTSDIDQLVLQMQHRPKHLSELKFVSLNLVNESITALRSSMELCQVALGRYNDVWKYNPNFDQTNIEELWGQFQVKPPTQLNSKLKERDMEYQFLRFFRFNSLLAAYPLSGDQIKQEAIADIPPLLRGEIWAAILGVKGDPDLYYKEFDDSTPCDTDRQLDLDIPRCHQYHDYLSTPLGHLKLKRILRAWIKSEKGKLVYWQGMDSLAACFLTLNFTNEALAFISMKHFIDKFCKGFFVLDNSKVMREYMLTFRYLISFHDPELAHHLHSIGLGPEFYAISWFMTLFAHVFALDKIYLLWDHILTSAEFFFMYIALSILFQLRDQLLESDFTNAMLVFADLGNINVETCIIDAIRYSKITPSSIFSFLKNELDDFSGGNSPDNNRFSFLSTKTTILPSISLEDFLFLRKQSLVLDARPLSVAMKDGHMLNSIVISLDGFGPKDTFSQGLHILLERKPFVIIVSNEDKCELGMLLLKTKQHRVCLLDPILFPENGELCQCKPVFFGNQFQSKCMGEQS